MRESVIEEGIVNLQQIRLTSTISRKPMTILSLPLPHILLLYALIISCRKIIVHGQSNYSQSWPWVGVNEQDNVRDMNVRRKATRCIASKAEWKYPDLLSLKEILGGIGMELRDNPGR